MLSPDKRKHGLVLDPSHTAITDRRPHFCTHLQ